MGVENHMKTAREVEKEIDDLIVSGKSSDEKERKKITERVKWLMPILMYLEANPSEQFVDIELRKAENKMKAINSRFVPPDNVTGKVVGELRATFNKEYGVLAIKKHIKNLKFILNK